MRLFIAINLSGEMKDALIQVQNEMYDQGIRGNFTPEENMHLTLAFIGEYPSAEPVLDALCEVAMTPFDITLEGIGCFRDLWWAGLKESVPLAASSLFRRSTRSRNVDPYPMKTIFMANQILKTHRKMYISNPLTAPINSPIRK